VHTTAGRVRVSRDFSGDCTRQIDQLLAGILDRNAAVTGITFPARADKAAHKAN